MIYRSWHPGTHSHPEEMADTETWDEGWPVRGHYCSARSYLEQRGNGIVQMWSGPGPFLSIKILSEIQQKDEKR